LSKTLDKFFVLCYNIITKEQARYKKMKKEYIDYLFEDVESGEQFLVEICKTETMSDGECFGRAVNIANEYFDDPTFIEEVDPEVAEMLGLDTY
jgi:hypothetical protein